MPSKNKKFWLAPVAFAGVSFLVLGALNPGSMAQTQPDHPDARLRTRHYKSTLSQVYQEVLNTIPELRTYIRPWRVTSHEENEVRAEVSVLVFTDDVVVTLKEEADGVMVDVHSASRVGKSDLGENRRHVLQLLSALDAKLAS
jgi:uncharacterized protein (DUF1499 family)